MPNWRKLIVGDAFHLPSRDLNFYRDNLLIWPVLIFSVAALSNLLSRGDDHRLGIILAGFSVLLILLARERVIVVAGALGFCTVQALAALPRRHDWSSLAIATACSLLFFLLIRSFKNYKPSYQWPADLYIVSLLLSLSSMGLSFALLLLVRWIYH
ncbi:MAG: hypothetical protein JSS48_17790 [Nitrospira sp.]|nr:hypothetical protein [Nitrospira sp.]